MAEPEKKKKKVTLGVAWREARELIWRYRSRMALGFFIMLVNQVAGLVLPASSKFLIDNVIKGGQRHLLLPIALAVLGATVIQAVTSFSLVRVLGVAAQRAITDLRREVQAHVLRLPVRYFDSTQTGILLSRVMNDAEGIRNLVGTGLVQLAGGLVKAAIAMGALFWLNWRLTTGTLVVLLVFAGGMAFAFTKLRPIFRERNKLMAAVSGRLTESFGGIRIVKSYVAERREDYVFTKGINSLFRNVATTMIGVGGVTALSTVVVGAIGALMIWVGGNDIIGGKMTLGDFVMYIFFTGLMAAPLIQIASIGTQVTEAFAGLDRIREIRSMRTEDDEDATRLPLPSVAGEIVFDDVTFEYNPGVPVLKHISFRAPAGSTTALVGSSGSGKSTLMSLVMAFNRPTEGMVYLDGKDLASLRLHDYRSRLGIVLQDNFLFDGTLADNIRFSRPGATMEDVRRVSHVAHCDEFIDGFEKQYDTIVGERGVRLSGGQRQRVAIARAILADPAVLLLDEATSSLDSESEALIQDGLRALRAGRTTFVIAHRLSTIMSADQILVLEAGEIVERGTHAELLAADGRYRQLYDKQFRLERNRFINPGEDFTPEPEVATAGAPRRPAGD
ncbi:MAG TPA: ABC transporter ATP-binding protein [Gemmatimonadales bacterium]|jgi:subfamily B ATP-binding cassette protein MsbA|nr:ABC transporter ATP-binding protein [Gemmatimonadales bacterium]